MNVVMAILVLGSTGNTWPQYGGDLLNDHWSTGRAGMEAEPEVKWIGPSGFWESFGSAIADVDDDGETEVLVINSDNDSTGLFCFNGDDGSVEWSYFVPNQDQFLISVPAVGDVDGDNNTEVLFCDSITLYCLNGNGSLKWSKSILVSNDAGAASPVIADVDDDGDMEVLIQSSDSVFCLSGSDGSREWAHSPSSVGATPAVVDLDGDGHTDVIVHSTLMVECLNGSDGTTKWCSRDLLGNIYYFSSSSPVVADVNGDGHLEVISSTRSQGDVYCFSDTGDTLWKVNLISSPSSHIQTPAVADLDGDGSVEIVALSDVDSLVYCLNGSDGSIKWTQKGNSDLHRGCSVADLDSDNKLEVLLPAHHGDRLICLNGEDGSVLWTKFFSGNADPHESVVGDIDNDGYLEIIVPLSSFVYALDAPDPTYEDTNEKAGDDGFYFKNMGSSLYLFVPTSTQVSLELYDASGRLVQNLFNGVLGPGAHTFVPNIKSKGVYMAVLKYQGRTQSVKITR